MRLWLLDGDDQVVRGGDVTDHDLVVRRVPEQRLRVGTVDLGQPRPVRWRTELDLTLLPERDALVVEDGTGPLHLLDHLPAFTHALRGLIDTSGPPSGSAVLEPPVRGVRA